MKKNINHLLRSRRFAPLFATQFLGALNDNLFKNALIILILYRLAQSTVMDGPVLVTLAAGIFILPFFLFSALAGQLADRFEKSAQIRIIKLAEILIMGLAGIAFMAGSAGVLLAILFLMGAQSAFFGPLKYAILPDHLHDEELIGANALVEAGTFLAILAGTILGGVLILSAQGTLIVSSALLAIAALGRISAQFIPLAPPPSPDLKLNYNLAGETWRLVREVLSRHEIRLIIIGISWFWLIGATFLSQFPALVKNVLGADAHAVTLFLTVFSVGIGIGSLACNKLLGGKISARFVPAGAWLMSAFIIDLFFATYDRRSDSGELQDIGLFLSTPANWRILIDLAGISMAAGVFIVPLYALLQKRSSRHARARTIAANNIFNAFFMVAGAGAAAVLLSGGISVPVILLIFGVLNALTGVLLLRLV